MVSNTGAVKAATRRPYSCTVCGSPVGAVRYQDTRTYVDIEIEDGETQLTGSDVEVTDENWHFRCSADSEHRLSPQLEAALMRLVEKASEFGLDF